MSTVGATNITPQVTTSSLASTPTTKAKRRRTGICYWIEVALGIIDRNESAEKRLHELGIWHRSILRFLEAPEDELDGPDQPQNSPALVLIRTSVINHKSTDPTYENQHSHH